MKRMSRSWRSIGYPTAIADLPIDDPEAGLCDYVDVAEKTFSHLGRLILIGHSMGGRLAPFVAKRFGEDRVEGMVLINSAVEKPHNVSEPEEPLPPKYYQGFEQEAYEIDEDGFRNYLPAARNYMLQDLTPSEADHIEANYRKQKMNIGDQSIDSWPGIRTLMLIGKLDRTLNPYHMIATARHIGAYTRFVDGGHFMQVSRTAEVIDSIRVFFQLPVRVPNLNHDTPGA